MAREVTKVELYGVNDAGDVRGWDCASGVKIPKGTVLKFASARTASASVGTGDLFAGVASADKSGTDFSTRVGTWQNGILEFTASGTVTVGHKVKTAAPGNYVMEMTAADMASSLQICIGYAIKTATTGTRVQVRVDN